MTIEEEVMAKLVIYNELREQILSNQRTEIVDEFRDWLQNKVEDIFDRKFRDDD